MCPTDLTLGMTWTLDFQGQIWNLPYLNKTGPIIATKWKANKSIEF